MKGKAFAGALLAPTQLTTGLEEGVVFRGAGPGERGERLGEELEVF